MIKQFYLSIYFLFISFAMQAQCTDLFFSEYIEGAGNDKALEIYNPTNAAINLSSYKIILKGFTGGGAPTTGSFSMSGTIASKGTYVICNSAASAGILAKKDTSLATGGGSIMNMNGDDALILVKNNTDTIDVIGNRFATDTTNAQAYTSMLKDKQLIRKNNVGAGTSDWNVGKNQWNIFTSISFSDLKLHTNIPCGGPLDTIINFNAPTSVLVEENAGTINIPLISNLSASAATIQANITLISGDPTDINGFTPQIVTFNSGSSSANLSVTITDDAIAEGRDTLKFKITSTVPNSIKIGTDSIFTLVINMSDRPEVYYAINTIRGGNFNGIPDSVDYAPIVLRGTVYGNDMDTAANGLRFVIRDFTGGILVNSASNSFGYNVTQGDSLYVRGKIGHISGWGSIDIDSLFVIKTGAFVKGPQINTTLSESTESDLIKISNVYVSPCTPWPTSGNANVDFTDGVNTYTVRLIKAQNFTKPTTRIDLIGIGGQFDNSSPYLSGYQIFPRKNADLSSNGNPIPQPPLYTIATVKADANSNGIADSNNVVCRLRGTVIGLSTGTGATNVIMKSGGKGIKVTATNKNYGLTLAVGDSIEVSGKVSDNAGWAEITANVCGDTIIKLGTGFVDNPIVITTLGESNESDLVRYDNLTRVSGTWSGTGNSNHIVKDALGNQFTVRIQNFNGSFGTVDLLTGNFSIIGLAGQFDTTSGVKTKGYQILPRTKSDIISNASVNTINNDLLVIYPNPTQYLIYYAGNQKADKATVTVYNTAGQIMMQSANNNQRIDVKALPAGNYIFEYISAEEKFVKRFVKE